MHCSIQGIIASKDFDFDDFFESLFKDESQKETGSYDDDRFSDQVQRSRKTSDDAAAELEQEISKKKKDNFLRSLRFTADEKEGKEKKNIKIKVPEEKKKAFLYYTQKLLDFVAIIRSQCDMTMRDELKDFLSVSDSVVSAVLSIQKQYLLRTFYHKDFNDLRKKIYNTLTKKTSHKSLRSVMLELQKMYQQKSLEEDEDDRLTFEQSSMIPAKKRRALIQDLKKITKEQLTPILDGLQKIEGHVYAVEQKNKKIALHKKKYTAPSSGRSGSSWRPSWGGDSNRRSGSGNRPRQGGYNDYGGGGYGGGSSGYYQRPRDDNRSSSPSTSTPTPSSSTGALLPSSKDKKEQIETKPQRLAQAINDFLYGYGKDITEAAKKLQKLPTKVEQTGEPGTKYLFNPLFKTMLLHPDSKRYYSDMHQIDSLYKNIEAEARAVSSKDGRKKDAKDEKKSKETELSSEQKALYQEFKKMQKMLLLPVQRARNLFCKTPGGGMIFPRAIADFRSFNFSEVLKMIEAAHQYLATLHAVDAEKNKKALEEQIHAYDQYTMDETKAIIACLQEYSKILADYTFEDETLPFGAEPSGPLDTRKDKRGINQRLKALIGGPKYQVLRSSAALKDLPYAESRQDFIGDSKISNDDDDWILNKQSVEKFLKYCGKICFVQFGLIETVYDFISYDYPTENVLKRFKELKDLVVVYKVNDELKNKIKTLLDKALSQEKNKNNPDLKLILKSEEMTLEKMQKTLDVDLRDRIKKKWELAP